MDGTVPFYYEPIKELNGVVVQVQPEYYGMLSSPKPAQARWFPRPSPPAPSIFTAWAIKANGFTSVVLDNRTQQTASAPR